MSRFHYGRAGGGGGGGDGLPSATKQGLSLFISQHKVEYIRNRFFDWDGLDVTIEVVACLQAVNDGRGRGRRIGDGDLFTNKQGLLLFFFFEGVKGPFGIESSVGGGLQHTEDVACLQTGKVCACKLSVGGESGTTEDVGGDFYNGIFFGIS